MGKYAPLQSFLQCSKKSFERLSFGHLSEILGFELPRSARVHRAWWGNDTTGHSHARSWLEVGWQVRSVDLTDGTVEFVRTVQRRPASRIAPNRGGSVKSSKCETLLSVGHQQRILVLIPCSMSKVSGGEREYRLDAGGPLGRLPPHLIKELVDLRVHIAKLLDECIDNDLRTASGRTTVPLLPAWKRYQGSLYKQVSPDLWQTCLNRNEVDVVIISALYGVVPAGEWIRDYDASMAQKTAAGRLCTIWKKLGLPRLLREFIRINGYSIVCDLLSLDYGKAVAGYAADLGDISVKRPNMAQYRSGSTYHRGIKLAKILVALLEPSVSS